MDKTIISGILILFIVVVWFIADAPHRAAAHSPAHKESTK